MPSGGISKQRQQSASARANRRSDVRKKPRRKSKTSARQPRSIRTRRIVGAMFAVLLVAGAVIATLIHFEKAIPPLLADDLPKAGSVLVEKAKRRLSLIRDGRAYRSYRISLGREPVGHKRREGDLRTPEGGYRLDWRNPDSCCYKSLHVSYPNEEDERLAAERGDDPGGLIMIHGQVNGWGWIGWLGPYLYKTRGCIALRNTHMEEIWNAVDDGTPIEIRP